MGSYTSSSKSAIELSKFRKSLKYSQVLGLRGIGLSEFSNLLGDDRLKYALLVTLDDGYIDNFDFAAPVLGELGIRGVFYLITSMIGKDGFMTKEHIRELHRSGHSIGSHSVTHRELDKLGDADLKCELTDSKRVLEDIVGESISSISYPKGSYDQRVADMAKECGYDLAFATNNGTVASWENRYSIKRYSVSGRDGSFKMFMKLFRRAYLK